MPIRPTQRIPSCDTSPRKTTILAFCTAGPPIFWEEWNHLVLSNLFLQVRKKNYITSSSSSPSKQTFFFPTKVTDSCYNNEQSRLFQQQCKKYGRKRATPEDTYFFILEYTLHSRGALNFCIELLPVPREQLQISCHF